MFFKTVCNKSEKRWKEEQILCLTIKLFVESKFNFIRPVYAFFVAIDLRQKYF